VDDLLAYVHIYTLVFFFNRPFLGIDPDHAGYHIISVYSTKHFA